MEKKLKLIIPWRNSPGVKKMLLYMKLTLVISLVAVLQTWAAVSYSQTTTLSINLKNATVQTVLQQVEDQSEFYFLYSRSLIDVDRTVDLQVKNAKITEVLNALFSGTDVAYKVDGRQIVLSKKPESSAFDMQQQKSISGKVSDSSGGGLPGVSVVVKGTTTGNITDFDGNYTLPNVPANAILQFSFVGMKMQEIFVGNKTSINVKLEDETIGLEEVVAVGYGVQKKSSLTGSISQVKSQDMSNRTITSAEQALQGKTSGVQLVTTSGKPGETSSIRVRGYSSNSDMSPLFVVDGIIVKDISGIEPNDIQSVEVLKDASSAAIYGAQAGNGVVLVTTKKGTTVRDGWGKISYDFQFSSQSLASTPHLMNAQQYAGYMVEGGIFSQNTIDKYWDGVTNTNWINTVFSSSLMKKHNLSFSNGNDKGSFYTSFSYLDNNGIQVGDKDVYTRLNGMINADYKIKPWFKLSTTNNIERSTNSSGGSSVINEVYLMDPLTPVTYSKSSLPDNMKSIMNNGWTILQDDKEDYYSVSNFFGFNNPMASLNSSTTKIESFALTGNFAGDFTPVKGLTITSKFGYNLESLASNTYNNDYYGSTQMYNKYVTLSQSNSTAFNLQWDNYINYANTFGDKHDVSAMLGHSYIKGTNYITTGGLTANNANAVLVDNPDLFGWLDYASSSATKTNSGTKSTNSSESYFGRVNYSYEHKYIAQVSLRTDAFDLSKLPVTNRWGYFPAGSVAWVISEENFWKSLPQVADYLKLRGSWGKNGSIGPLSGYLYATTMASGNKYSFGTDSNYQYITSSSPASMGNDNLSWETSTQFDLGFDTRFLNGRLSATVDWFNKKTDDLLVTGLKSSLLAGGNFSPMNAGSVENKGIEFEIGWEDKIGKVSYGIRANASTLKNKVTYLDKSIDYIEGTRLLNDPVTIFEEGFEVWHFYGYKFTGINPENGEALFEDINKDGSITTEDRTNIGSAIPKFTYGLTLTASYKGFDAIVFGSGTQGNEIFQCLFSNDRTSGNRIYDEFYKDRWTSTNTGGTKPAASADISKYIVSSAMVKDGSFFRIKQIQLGYTVPKSILSKVQIAGMRLYVSLDDWFLFTKYDGFDPESSSAGTGSQQGVDKGIYPISKKIVAGLNITF